MAVTIGGTTVPDYSEQDFKVYLPGTSYQMADGTMHHDNLISTERENIVIKWRAVSKANKDIIQGKFLDAISTVQTFVDINGSSYSVFAERNGLTIKQIIGTGSNSRYDITINFYEEV
jgi:hypothetical protein